MSEALIARIETLEAELRRAHERIAWLEAGLNRVCECMVRPGTAAYELQQAALRALDGAGDPAPRRFKA